MKIEIDRLTLVQARDALDLAQALCEKSVHHGQLLTAYTALREALAAPQPEQQVPVTIDNIVGSAMRRYLRVCSSGGMSSKNTKIVQANVDEAERLGYFELAIAEAILADRRRQADRIAELEAEVIRFRTDAMNEKAARQALEQQLAAREPLTDDEWFKFWGDCDEIPGDSVYPEFLELARIVEAYYGIQKDPA